MCQHCPTHTTNPSVTLSVHLPEWINEVVDWQHPLHSDDDKMALAVELARQNVLRGTGVRSPVLLFTVPAGSCSASV